MSTIELEPGMKKANMGRRSSVAAMPPTNMQLGGSRPGSPESIASVGSIKSTATGRSISSDTENSTSKEPKPFRHPDGTYEGTTNMNLMPDGEGSYFYKNGDVFVGMWENGIREGKGEMTYTTNESYTGMYHLSLAHGHGRYCFSNGDIYEGEFKSGYMHGRGEYIYKMGGSYNGLFRKGSKCDNYGLFKYPNGDVYKGRFHENVPHGKGQLVFKGSRENPNPKPLDVWNGKLIEKDVRPSMNGAYTNFNEEDDVEKEYPESDSDSDSNSDDEDTATVASGVSRYTLNSTPQSRSQSHFHPIRE